MKIGSREYDFGGIKPYVMGILNVTPDSFSDGGRYTERDEALKQAERMIAEGVDIIDIGGESTRPGYTRISDEEEIERVVPVLKALKDITDLPLSLDTYKTAVAAAGLEAGADIINDIWGVAEAEELKDICRISREKDTGIMIMHNRKNPEYEDFAKDVIEDMKSGIRTALDAGIALKDIMVDPGIGFAKTYEENVRMMTLLEEFKQETGCPVLLGISRKSIIGKTLDLPFDQREEATIALNVYGYMKGCRVFRVHDVEKNRRALDMIARLYEN